METGVISPSMSSCIETEILVPSSGTESGGRLLDYLILCVFVATRWYKVAPFSCDISPCLSSSFRNSKQAERFLMKGRLNGFSWWVSWTVFHERKAEHFFMTDKLNGFAWRASWTVSHEWQAERFFMMGKLNSFSWMASWTVFHDGQAEQFFMKGKLNSFSWRVSWTVFHEWQAERFFVKGKLTLKLWSIYKIYQDDASPLKMTKNYE